MIYIYDFIYLLFLSKIIWLYTFLEFFSFVYVVSQIKYLIQLYSIF